MNSIVYIMFHDQRSWNQINAESCLTNCCYRKTSAHKSVCYPASNIGKNSHGQPWQDTEEPRLGKVELQNLRKKTKIRWDKNKLVHLYWHHIVNVTVYDGCKIHGYLSIQIQKFDILVKISIDSRLKRYGSQIEERCIANIKQFSRRIIHILSISNFVIDYTKDGYTLSLLAKFHYQQIRF